ncbi:MAG TPA: hypothetical protein VK493_09060, partial [Bryobacteraceae bacterium]|nr:hypothetical protein [Bryobacteraceae bacterium]
MASYLESQTPVAITRHGATIGIYVPTHRKPSEADLEALRVAGEKMQSLLLPSVESPWQQPPSCTS